MVFRYTGATNLKMCHVCGKSIRGKQLGAKIKRPTCRSCAKRISKGGVKT